MLKNRLLSMESDSNEELYTLCLEMMNYIGSPDPILRDDLIYRTLERLIPAGAFTDEQLHRILEISLGRTHLFFNIDTIDENGVFTRSFSALVIALVLAENKKHHFLYEQDLLVIHDAVIEYLGHEWDLRGYVPGKGWARGIAHIADVIDILVKQDDYPGKRRQQLLEAMFEKMATERTIYVYQEEERMLNPLMTILEQGFDEEVLLELLSKMLVKMDYAFLEMREDDYAALYMNVTRFLRGLFFRLEASGMFPLLKNDIEFMLLHEVRTFS
ncbi:DUF2785 domain-containing protein [Bacillus marinisedimentorum]|uniref:DUF2785 domain-containing protein n=1 Tax=Bacillus marinisedimentorum TaxID=1821260 RepID=UPI001470E341|nr:DUF2785 domain-containing protein [Bacillus marinisedimentorum]